MGTVITVVCAKLSCKGDSTCGYSGGGCQVVVQRRLHLWAQGTVVCTVVCTGVGAVVCTVVCTGVGAVSSMCTPATKGSCYGDCTCGGGCGGGWVVVVVDTVVVGTVILVVVVVAVAVSSSSARLSCSGDCTCVQWWVQWWIQW